MGVDVADADCEGQGGLLPSWTARHSDLVHRYFPADGQIHWQSQVWAAIGHHLLLVPTQHNPPPVPCSDQQQLPLPLLPLPPTCPGSRAGKSRKASRAFLRETGCRLHPRRAGTPYTSREPCVRCSDCMGYCGRIFACADGIPCLVNVIRGCQIVSKVVEGGRRKRNTHS